MFVRLCLLTFVLSVGLLIPETAGASKVTHADKKKVVRAAHVIFVAKITKTQVRKAKCSVTLLYEMAVEKMLTGKLVRGATITYSRWYPHLYDKKGHIPGCDSSVSYIDPPAASNLKVGAKVIAAAKVGKASKTYGVTGTFDLSRKKEILGWLKR
jgi:hypothetical protein